jgi:Tfp pilus assembly protein PilN
MKAVNLLPPDMRGASRSPERTVVTDDSSGFGAYVLIGVLSFAVLALAGVVLTGNAVKDREAKLASAQAQQQQVAARAAALKPYAEFDQMASERVATVRDLAGRRFDWEQAIRDLSRAIPGDVTLSEINGNVSTDTGGSGAGSTIREAIAAPAITLKGCTGDQRSVARLMARLRNVDGVTRVSLSKSEKTDLAQGAGAGSEVPVTDGAVDRSAPCGEGKKPEFELVMFFEGDAEAATGPSATPVAPGQEGADGGAAPAPAGGTTSTTTTTSTPGQTDGAQSTPAPAAAGATPTATPTQGGVTP